MRHRRLADWLAWQETLHPRAIDLSLERMRLVAGRLDLLRTDAWVMTVAGTNGKGSCVAYAAAMLRAAGRDVGSYTSPHLLHYCERIRVNGRAVEEGVVMGAFDAIDQARGGISLSYFEFGTLAARYVFRQFGVQAQVLEVGLGGRLDAVNTFDPDVALVTSIGLDHVDWLGTDREAVGREKAGIFRPGRPAVFAGADMPASVERHAADTGTPLVVAGRDYHWGVEANGRWWYADDATRLERLAPPPLPGAVQVANAAGVLRALRHAPGLRPSEDLWAAAAEAHVDGRMQRLPGKPVWWLDVAHNPDSAAVLAGELRRVPCTGGRRYACFALMARKDLAEVLAPLKGHFDGWYLLTLPDPDAWPAGPVRESLAGEALLGDGPPEALFPVIRSALAPGDELVVFGSFRTVEEALRFRGVDRVP